MGEDEENALHLLKINKKIHEENFRRFSCTFYKQIGDGFLAIFDSTINAVYASGTILSLCKENKIGIRIGIHEGEVVFKDNDVFGDEVNIASRIEQAAQVNRIYISENVKRLTENKRGLKAGFTREYRLKNVRNPIKIYDLEVDLEKISIPAARQSKHSWKRIYSSKKHLFYAALILLSIFLFSLYLLKKKPILNPFNPDKVSLAGLSGKSFAVLPFQNLSGDMDNDFLGDGFADNIILNLSKIPDFRVISRSSSFKYRDTDYTIKRIGRELGVENIIEGGIQVAQNVIRIDIKLIHCNSGDVILAESYDGELDDIFGIQEKVASGLKSALSVSFSPEQKSGSQKINLQSFRYYQAGQSLLKENYLSRNTILVSRMQFKKAIDEDPLWIAPYVGMAESLLMDVHYGYKPFQSQKDSVQYYIGKINEINQTGWEINYLQGLTEFFQLEFQRSEILFTKAAELNPGYPFIYYYLSWLCFNKNDYEASYKYMDKAISLDPLNEYFKVIYGILLSFGGQHQRAVNMFMKMLNKDPGNNSTLFGLGTVYSNMGNHEKAIEVLSRRSVGQKTNFLMAYNYGRTGKTKDARRILDYLLNLPGENAAPLTQIAIVYLGLNDFDKALDYYGDALEHYDPWISWMPQNWSDPIRKDPRFIEITGRFKTYQN